MNMSISQRELYEWCRVPHQELEGHPDLKIPFRLVENSESMGQLMARELVAEIQAAASQGDRFRAIIPCGPSCWYQPFTDLVNRERVSLRQFEVFHMDECLDWQGRELPRSHPYSFRGAMERQFYDPVGPELAVPEGNRRWLRPDNVEEIRREIASEAIHLTYGGWGQDGHIAYNQARRHPYNRISVQQLRDSSVRIQENNWDTILALAQRSFGSAYQFVPPMSVTLGLKECLAAAKVRLFSDTGAWKQTALRVALFSPPTSEYPITLLQEHPAALVTATVETATHPISAHPEWDLGLED
jgi:glucosamine-6-phosphate deaminase